MNPTMSSPDLPGLTGLTDPTIELLASMARRFRDFAERDGQDDVLYAAISALIADDPALHGLLAEAPATQRLPVLLLAAIHDRILDETAPRHALHSYYPTAGGDQRPDAALRDALTDFVAREREALLRTVRTRTTQTNEIGRCAVLRVALQALALRSESTGPQRLALFDFGCSAGLNLAVQDYGYDDGERRIAGLDATAPVITHQWRRRPPQPLLAERRWAVVERRGVDLSPVAPDDVIATRWLRACLWPHDRVRTPRLVQALALALAQRQPATLIQSGDGLRELEDWLATLPGDVQPVLLNTWVLAYFDREARQRYADRVAALVRERGLAWISAEMGKYAVVDPRPDASPGEPAATTTLWTLQWRDRGALRTEALAWSHAHGRWVDWVAD